MKGVLVDTSVWVEHFRHNSPELVNLLSQDRVLIHPMVIGELACGTPPDRSNTLTDLGDLRGAQQPTVSEVVAFSEHPQTLWFGLWAGGYDASGLRFIERRSALDVR
nr:hypothetical protein pPsy0462a_00044 [Pseudomonas syringae]